MSFVKPAPLRLAEAPLQPPVAARIPSPTVIHGHTLDDDYAWLRDKSSPEVLAYLHAENAYTDAAMANTKDLQAELYDEMLSHIKETDESVPYPDRGWLYWTRTLEGSQYPIYCRRRNASGSPEEILLDVNKLAAGQPYMAIGTMVVSPDGRLLAYSTDNTGFRQYTLHIRDLTTGQDLPDTALRTGSIVWAADSVTLFYTTEDEQTKRTDKLFRHTVSLGDETNRMPHSSQSHRDEWAATDALVFEEPDERFNVGAGITRDRKYILVESGSHTTSECRFFPADQPLAPLTLIAPRIDDQEYYPDHRDGLLYIRTNDTTKNFRLVVAPVATPGRDHWREVFTGEDDIPLEDFDLFQTFCVLTERKAGLPTLAIYPLTGNPVRDFANDFPHEVEFPETHLLRRPLAQPRVRRHPLPLRLPITRLAAVGIRLQRRHRALHPAQAAGGTRRLPRLRLRLRTPLGRGPRRGHDPGFPRLPPQPLP